ncbi:unnamed protein product, partial [Owenia fusiformis]
DANAEVKKMLKNSIKIAPGAIVCSECEIKGDVTIGARTVIHPKARIIAEAGPIVIGDSNLIEEQAQIINKASDAGDGGTKAVMVIGNNNQFEVGCYSEAMQIGDNNILETKAIAGKTVLLTNGCIIGAQCEVTSNETLPENTVIYGRECQRRVQSERPPPQTLQLDFLTKILPNYHHMKKPNKREK